MDGGLGLVGWPLADMRLCIAALGWRAIHPPSDGRAAGKWWHRG
jgi:hypothetical protein